MHRNEQEKAVIPMIYYQGNPYNHGNPESGSWYNHLIETFEVIMSTLLECLI